MNDVTQLRTIFNSPPFVMHFITKALVLLTQNPSPHCDVSYERPLMKNFCKFQILKNLFCKSQALLKNLILDTLENLSVSFKEDTVCFTDLGKLNL